LELINLLTSISFFGEATAKHITNTPDNNKGMSKKNEQKESCGGVKIIREMHRKMKSALKSKIHESFEKK
jgi:hypothetical protein